MEDCYDATGLVFLKCLETITEISEKPSDSVTISAAKRLPVDLDQWLTIVFCWSKGSAEVDKGNFSATLLYNFSRLA